MEQALENRLTVNTNIKISESQFLGNSNGLSQGTKLKRVTKFPAVEQGYCLVLSIYLTRCSVRIKKSCGGETRHVLSLRQGEDRKKVCNDISRVLKLPQQKMSCNLTNVRSIEVKHNFFVSKEDFLFLGALFRL